jgi:hypothetical protein
MSLRATVRKANTAPSSRAALAAWRSRLPGIISDSRTDTNVRRKQFFSEEKNQKTLGLAQIRVK